MLNFHRVADLLVPSVPPELRTEVETSVASRLGEVRGATDQTPESGAGSFLSPVPASFSGPPARERYQSEPVHPSVRYLLEDRHLAALLDSWKRASS